MIEGKLVALELHNGFGAYASALILAVWPLWVSEPGIGKIAEIAVAGLSFSQVPPSLWTRARPVVGAVRVVDPIRIITPPTKLHHFVQTTPALSPR
jgi:hypothetical protein